MIRRRTLGRPAGALAAALLAAGCAGGHPAAAPGRAPAPAVSAPPASLVKVPRPDYASPASVRRRLLHPRGPAWTRSTTVGLLRGPLRPLVDPGTGAAAGRQQPPTRHGSRCAPPGWSASCRCGP